MKEKFNNVKSKVTNFYTGHKDTFKCLGIAIAAGTIYAVGYCMGVDNTAKAAGEFFKSLAEMEVNE